MLDYSQFSSVAQSCPTLCDTMDCSTPDFPVHHQLSEPAQTHIHQVGDTIQHLILCHPLFFLPSIFPSIRVFSKESVLPIRRPKYWSFRFIISPSKEYSGLISFRMDWFDLLAAQGTLKSLLQYHSSKVLILWHSAFFIIQISHPYMTTGKTIPLTRLTFVRKVMSMLFNMLSRLVIAFLSRSITLLSFTEPIFAWNVPLVSLIFLKRSLVFPILLFSSISLHFSWGRLSYLSLLFFGTLHSNGYIFPFFLCLLLLFFSAICKVSLDLTNHFVFLHFFFLGIILIMASCTILWTSVHSSSGILFTKSSSLPLCNIGNLT